MRTFVLLVMLAAVACNGAAPDRVQHGCACADEKHWLCDNPDGGAPKLVECVGANGCDDNRAPACDMEPMPGGHCFTKQEGNAYCYSASLISVCKSGTWTLSRCLRGCIEDSDAGYVACAP